MNILADVFYWISTGLLVPVMFFLLLGFGYALAQLGGFYAQYRDRRHYRMNLRLLEDLARSASLRHAPFAEHLAAHPRFLQAIMHVQQHDWQEPYISKAIADFEAAADKQLETSKSLMRVGPMLGLMGTLIPMGPALVGLAAGDIASMAMNMQVAFSTTVIGVFVGAIGFILHSVRTRWFSEDHYQLQFLIQLAEHEET